MLVQASWQWVRRDPAAQGLFQRLVSETGCAQKAIVGVARHLAILLWQLVTTESDYMPGHPAGQGPEPAMAQS